MARARGLILAAPASGSGKTLVAAGLLRYLRRRGVRVAAAKAGPDFIDPTFHTAAGKCPCLNLDPWAMRPETLAANLATLDSAAELILCEGTMGLFDGTGRDGEAGSTAELARLTGWPVILVVDARGQGASVAALLEGFAGHREDVAVAGVVFNRVASARHAALLAKAAARHVPMVAVLGALQADPALALPARHLGLVPAGEIADLESLIERAATAVGAALDIDRLCALARPDALVGETGAGGMAPFGQRIAVARDAAFCFLYPALLEGWRRAGAELCFFSPLADGSPDPAADAVYLPGGYPELWAGRLAAAERFLSGLRRTAASDRAVYGECGGYMVLGEALIDAAGCRHAMAGLLPLTSSFAERRLTLGYRAVSLIASGPLGASGAGFHGHEFHYASIVCEGVAARLWSAQDAAGATLGACGLTRASVAGSFIHLIDRV